MTAEEIVKLVEAAMRTYTQIAIMAPKFKVEYVAEKSAAFTFTAGKDVFTLTVRRANIKAKEEFS
jgi:hypothetical protein